MISAFLAVWIPIIGGVAALVAAIYNIRKTRIEILKHREEERKFNDELPPRDGMPPQEPSLIVKPTLSEILRFGKSREYRRAGPTIPAREAGPYSNAARFFLYLSLGLIGTGALLALVLWAL